LSHTYRLIPAQEAEPFMRGSLSFRLAEPAVAHRESLAGSAIPPGVGKGKSCDSGRNQCNILRFRNRPRQCTRRGLVTFRAVPRNSEMGAVTAWEVDGWNFT
jgi:hypothetical protein